MTDVKRLINWVNLVLALWIALSPALFFFAGGGGFTVGAGIVLLVLVIGSLRKGHYKGWTVTVLILSAFLFFTPWIFSYGGGAAINVRIVSLVMVILSTLGLRKPGQSGTKEAPA